MPRKVQLVVVVCSFGVVLKLLMMMVDECPCFIKSLLVFGRLFFGLWFLFPQLRSTFCPVKYASLHFSREVVPYACRVGSTAISIFLDL